jgi:hypothetical protein
VPSDLADDLAARFSDKDVARYVINRKPNRAVETRISSLAVGVPSGTSHTRKRRNLAAGCDEVDRMTPAPSNDDVA